MKAQKHQLTISLNENPYAIGGEGNKTAESSQGHFGFLRPALAWEATIFKNNYTWDHLQFRALMLFCILMGFAIWPLPLRPA